MYRLVVVSPQQVGASGDVATVQTIVLVDVVSDLQLLGDAAVGGEFEIFTPIGSGPPAPRKVAPSMFHATQRQSRRLLLSSSEKCV